MTDPTWPITCTITGKPVPKPDPVCYGGRGHHRLTIPKKPDYVEWRGRVEAMGRKVAEQVGGTLEVPVEINLTFRFERPQSHYGTGRNRNVLKPGAPTYPTGRNIGDVDKLERAVFDALTQGGLWLDDSLAVTGERRKVWATPPIDLPGLTIRVRPATPPGDGTLI